VCPTKRSIAVLLGTLVLSFPAAAGSAVEADVSHLLLRLEQSNCRFNRNGTWYPSTDARQHIEKKYRYLAEKGAIKNAEDFIVQAASSSSVSGKPYLVQCGSDAALPAAGWLRDELQRYRNATPR
jgi:hypothetical protein